MNKLIKFPILALFVIVSACQSENKSSTSSDSLSNDSLFTSIKIKKEDFTATVDGKQVSLFVLRNKHHAKAVFTNYGGRIISLLMPDKNEKLTDVVVGFNSLNSYMDATEPYFGATIGRYGNRIANGKFILDGKPYSLSVNNGPNTLHGGKKGYQYVVWDAKQNQDNEIIFHYLSKDMEQGFPGNLTIDVTYLLTDDNALKITYRASTDATTVANLTNHAFFNLNGEGSGSILDHLLNINANQYTPVDSTLIPTGRLESVKNTPFDFTKAEKIGTRIEQVNQQLKFGKGYDHNYVLDKTPEMGMFHAATVVGDRSGIKMEIYTQEPGLQFYSGNFMEGKNSFKTGVKDEFRTAFCLETQHFPDSPNQPSFPTTTLKKGELYETTSIYKFSK